MKKNIFVPDKKRQKGEVLFVLEVLGPVTARGVKTCENASTTGVAKKNRPSKNHRDNI